MSTVVSSNRVACTEARTDFPRESLPSLYSSWQENINLNLL
jgi:hypothetical protein